MMISHGIPVRSTEQLSQHDPQFFYGVWFGDNTLETMLLKIGHNRIVGITAKQGFISVSMLMSCLTVSCPPIPPGMVRSRMTTSKG
jgi:hypothetical protein